MMQVMPFYANTLFTPLFSDHLLQSHTFQLIATITYESISIYDFAFGAEVRLFFFFFFTISSLIVMGEAEDTLCKHH